MISRHRHLFGGDYFLDNKPG